MGRYAHPHLRPCPFCHGQAWLKNDQGFHVRCLTVDCPGFSMEWDRETEDGAVNTWNGENFTAWLQEIEFKSLPTDFKIKLQGAVVDEKTGKTEWVDVPFSEDNEKESEK